MLFDSHLHFDTTDGHDGIAATVARARAAGVNRMLAVGGSPSLNRRAIMAARHFPGQVYAAIGWDRDQAVNPIRASLMANAAAMRRYWQRRRERCQRLGVAIVALGEIGLDYHYDPDSADAQRRLMDSQLQAAAALHLPVIVHTRNADNDTLHHLAAYHALCRQTDPHRSPLGVVHCYTGSKDFAHRLLDLDLMLGFSGIITFRNAASLRETARSIPDDRLLIETDAPYLAPVPYRGRRNESARLPAVLQCLADARQTPPEELGRITTDNANRLFLGTG